MSCFPLYDNLLALRKGRRYLSKDEKQQLIDNINSLNQDGHNKIFALIMYHQKIHNVNCLSANWLNYMTPTVDITINLTSLPVVLQEIIEVFVEKHIAFMKDEEEREIAKQ